MIKIPLTQGRYAIIDDDDSEVVSQYDWYYNDGYAKAYHKGKRLRMHRLIMKANKGQYVDHINHNTLDNRKENLRLCTRKENNRNQGKRKDNTSGYMGIYLDRSTGRWRPVIYVDGKAIYAGSFPTPHIAALARDLWVVDPNLHGKFANTNFKVISSG